MYGEIAEPGMGTYPPRARRNRGVSPRGNSRRARLASDWSRVGGGRALGQLDWDSENAGMKVICLLYCIRQPGSIIRLKVDQAPYTPAPSLPDVRLVSLSTRGHQPFVIG